MWFVKGGGITYIEQKHSDHFGHKSLLGERGSLQAENRITLGINKTALSFQAIILGRKQDHLGHMRYEINDCKPSHF